MQNLDQQINLQQNTECLEQQFYASPENFTPALLVMLETFRRSDGGCMDALLNFHGGVVKLFGGGSVINGSTRSSYLTGCLYFSQHHNFHSTHIL